MFNVLVYKMDGNILAPYSVFTNSREAAIEKVKADLVDDGYDPSEYTFVVAGYWR